MRAASEGEQHGPAKLHAERRHGAGERPVHFALDRNAGIVRGCVQLRGKQVQPRGGTVGNVGIVGIRLEGEQRRDDDAGFGDHRALPLGFRGHPAVIAFQAADARAVVVVDVVVGETGGVELPAVQRPRVDVEVQLAAVDRLVGGEGVVEGRQDEGLFLVAGGKAGVEDLFLHVELDPPQVEIVPVVQAEKEKLILPDEVIVAADAVGAREVLVGLGHDIPAVCPARVDVEAPLAADHASPGAQIAVGVQPVYRVGVEGGCIALADSGDRQRILAAVEALAELGLREEALRGVVGAGGGQVVGRRQREVVGHPDADADFVVELGRGRQEAGFPLDRRIGNLRHGEVGDRQPEEFETRVLEADRLGFAVPDHAARLDAPDRRPVRVLLAGRAGGVDAVEEGGQAPALALGAFGRDVCLVHGFDAQRVDEALAEILGDVDLVRENSGALPVDDLHAVVGLQPAALPVEDNGFRDDPGAGVLDADAARRRHDVLVVVVDQLVGFKQELGVVRGGRAVPRQGPQILGARHPRPSGREKAGERRRPQQSGGKDSHTAAVLGSRH